MFNNAAIIFDMMQLWTWVSQEGVQHKTKSFYSCKSRSNVGIRIVAVHYLEESNEVNIVY
jgi:hypothetical protein